MLFSALVSPLIESTTAQLIVIAMPVSQLPSSNAEDNKVKLILKFLGCPIFRRCIPVASGGCLYSARDFLIVGCRCPGGSCMFRAAKGLHVNVQFELKWIPIIPTSLVQQVTKYLPFEVGTGIPKRCGLNLVDLWKPFAKTARLLCKQLVSQQDNIVRSTFRSGVARAHCSLKECSCELAVWLDISNFATKKNGTIEVCGSNGWI